MSKSDQKPKRFHVSVVGISIAFAAIVVHAAALVVFDLAPMQVAPQPPASPFITLRSETAEGAVAREQALLLDSAPLFLPTPWNTALAGQEVVETQPDPNLFEAFPDEITLNPDQLRPKPRSVPPPSLSMLDGGKPRLLDYLGEDDRQLSVLPKRAARYEIVRLSDSRLMAAGVLPEDEILAKVPMLWQSTTFLLQLAPEGPLGPAFQSQSSGSDEVDKSLRSFVESSDFSERLKPGYYAVTIGP